MRFRQYKCPRATYFPGECMYEGFDNDVCINCHKSVSQIETVWDKFYYNWYLNVVPFEYRPKNLWYQFKCWAWRRHTTIKPRKLDHTWHDRSGLIYHLIFEVLCQFVEQELSKETINWHSDDGHTKAYNTMMYWYDWYINKYQLGFPFNLPIEEYVKIEKNALNMQQEMENKLKEGGMAILGISDYMWT